ncbi:hypothetical protein HDU96_003608 [Phlyctochytrium bullatum]|nr:hypothetical protein HDU96_003608 [Phlyctochytrium bullatum]
MTVGQDSYTISYTTCGFAPSMMSTSLLRASVEGVQTLTSLEGQPLVRIARPAGLAALVAKDSPMCMEGKAGAEVNFRKCSDMKNGGGLWVPVTTKSHNQMRQQEGKGHEEAAAEEDEGLAWDWEEVLRSFSTSDASSTEEEDDALSFVERV